MSKAKEDETYQEIREDLLADYEMHNVKEEMLPYLEFIEKELIPLYDKYSYRTNDACFLLKKLRMVDELFCVMPQCMTHYMTQGALSIAVTFNNLALVEDEFHPKFNTASMGSKSANIIQKKYLNKLSSYLGIDRFQFNPVIAGIESFDSVANMKNTKNHDALALNYASWIHDIEFMARIAINQHDIFGEEDFIQRYLHDYVYELYPDKDPSVAMNIGLQRLKAKYGRNGNWRLLEMDKYMKYPARLDLFRNNYLTNIEETITREKDVIK